MSALIAGGLIARSLSFCEQHRRAEAMMKPPPPNSDNLFVAGKGNALAAVELMRRLDAQPALIMPIIFLSAFAFELTLKAAIKASGGKPERYRHDLREAFAEVVRLGYLPPRNQAIELVIEGLADGHKHHHFRYVPDVERIDHPPLPLIALALKAHVDAIEDQFSVWTDTPEPDLG